MAASTNLLPSPGGIVPLGQSAAHPLLTQVLQGIVLSHLTLSLRHSAQAISPLTRLCALVRGRIAGACDEEESDGRELGPASCS